MTLREKQSLFARLLADLIVAAYDLGYEVTFGDVFAATGHMADSLHGLRLAADLNLFRNGKYLETTESHRTLGGIWKTMHPLCRWGGDFKKPDGNHYSITHGGKA